MLYNYEYCWSVIRWFVTAGRMERRGLPTVPQHLRDIRGRQEACGPALRVPSSPGPDVGLDGARLGRYSADALRNRRWNHRPEHVGQTAGRALRSHSGQARHLFRSILCIRIPVYGLSLEQFFFLPYNLKFWPLNTFLKNPNFDLTNKQLTFFDM